MKEEVTPQMSKTDQEKKVKQQPKIDKVMDKLEVKKNKAAELFKLGQYGEAV